MRILKKHLNKLGICSGGVLMDWIDKECAKQATRIMKGKIVTAHFECDFENPAKLGDKLDLEIVHKKGNRSIKIYFDVYNSKKYILGGKVIFVKI